MKTRTHTHRDRLTCSYALCPYPHSIVDFPCQCSIFTYSVVAGYGRASFAQTFSIEVCVCALLCCTLSKFTAMSFWHASFPFIYAKNHLNKNTIFDMLNAHRENMGGGGWHKNIGRIQRKTTTMPKKYTNSMKMADHHNFRPFGLINSFR